MKTGKVFKQGDVRVITFHGKLVKQVHSGTHWITIKYWDGTEIIKKAHKKHLRKESKKAVQERE